MSSIIIFTFFSLLKPSVVVVILRVLIVVCVLIVVLGTGTVPGTTTITPIEIEVFAIKPVVAMPITCC